MAGVDGGAERRKRTRPLRGRTPAEPTGEAAIAISGLAKSFNGRWAVNGVHLRVPPGCFFGLVGPNGAGKTTTLMMTTGLLRPDRGTVAINGLDVWTNLREVKAQIGILPEDPRLFDRLAGGELLTYHGLLHGLGHQETIERAGELLRVLGLVDAANVPVVDYSQGMRKKIGLATALLHAPRVLFLDEPFESVDPVSSRTIKDVLRSFVGGGGTVVFSSHVMETVERVCDHVAIMHKGNLVGAGPMEDVCNGATLEDTFFRLVGAEAAQESDLSWLSTSSS